MISRFGAWMNKKVPENLDWPIRMGLAAMILFLGLLAGHNRAVNLIQQTKIDQLRELFDIRKEQTRILDYRISALEGRGGKP